LNENHTAGNGFWKLHDNEMKNMLSLKLTIHHGFWACTPYTTNTKLESLVRIKINYFGFGQLVKICYPLFYSLLDHGDWLCSTELYTLNTKSLAQYSKWTKDIILRIKGQALYPLLMADI